MFSPTLKIYSDCWTGAPRCHLVLFSSVTMQDAALSTVGLEFHDVTFCYNILFVSPHIQILYEMLLIVGLGF